MILVRDIRLPLSAGEPQAFEKALHLARIPRSKAAHLGVARLSVDARHGQPKLVYTIAVTLKDEGEESAYAGASPCVAIRGKTDLSVQNGTQRLPHRPVVCGLGPAGLFAALLLARQGYKPIVLERGPALDERVKAVEHFSATGELDPNANIQFGEGGAGTFSDGKLTTRIGDELCGLVTEVFLQHGAPAEIAWKQKPHVGTDLLRGVITSIRREIEALGGEVHFNTALTGFEQKNGRLTGIFTTGGTFPCEALVFAVGHSARDTFRMLFDAGVPMEPKSFAVGVRIEHLQSDISAAQYGSAWKRLPPSDYKLACHLPDGRSAFTFCVCPGGEVVAAASEPGHLVTNGMSRRSRGGRNCNGGLLVGVSPADFASSHPLAGMQFQELWESRAFDLGGGSYFAPAQTVGSLLSGSTPSLSSTVEATYRPGVVPADLRLCLPGFVTDTLRSALPLMGKRLHGFDAPEALLTGVETRSSSPVRLLRGADLQSPVRGLYPCGEGGGWAGGIMSAAADGIRVAERIAAP